MNNNTRLTLSIAIGAGLVLSVASMLAVFSPMSAEAKNNVGQGTDQVEKFRISGKVADAHWYVEDEEEETFTDVSIYLIDSAQNVYEDYPESFLEVFISQYKITETCVIYDGEEYCYYDYEPVVQFFGYAELKKSDFAISNNIRSASVTDVQVTGYEYVSGDEKTIIVDAKWIGEGSTLKVKSSYSETNEFYKVSFKGMGVGKDATASADISGDIDISLDQISYSDASILKFRQGYMFRIIEEPY